MPARRYGQRGRWLLRTNFRRTLTLQQRNKIFSIIRTSQVGWLAARRVVLKRQPAQWLC